jgi:hypothetical protein
VRPDAFARWREGDRAREFLLEYDTGTETLDRVAAKLAGFHDLAEATRIWTPTLFWLPGPAREANLRTALDSTHHAVAVATGHPVADRNPAEAVWLPLGQRGPRQRLIDLADPLPLRPEVTDGKAAW